MKGTVQENITELQNNVEEWISWNETVVHGPMQAELPLKSTYV